MLNRILHSLTWQNWTSCVCVTNVNPTDLKYNIRIRCIRILAGSVTSLKAKPTVTVRTANKGVHITMDNCSIQYSAE